MNGGSPQVKPSCVDQNSTSHNLHITYTPFDKVKGPLSYISALQMKTMKSTVDGSDHHLCIPLVPVRSHRYKGSDPIQGYLRHCIITLRYVSLVLGGRVCSHVSVCSQMPSGVQLGMVAQKQHSCVRCARVTIWQLLRS